MGGQNKPIELMMKAPRFWNLEVGLWILLVGCVWLLLIIGDIKELNAIFIWSLNSFKIDIYLSLKP